MLCAACRRGSLPPPPPRCWTPKSRSKRPSSALPCFPHECSSLCGGGPSNQIGNAVRQRQPDVNPYEQRFRQTAAILSKPSKRNSRNRAGTRPVESDLLAAKLHDRALQGAALKLRRWAREIGSFKTSPEELETPTISAISCSSIPAKINVGLASRGSTGQRRA